MNSTNAVVQTAPDPDNPSPSPKDTTETVQPRPLSGVNGFWAIPFAVTMPSSSLQDVHKMGNIPEEQEARSSSTTAMMGDNGIVGSIVLLGEKSAMIWVGWGRLQLFGGENASSDGTGFGTGTPTMGQLLVAMPRIHYKGAFGGVHSKEPACSMLMGSASDQTLGTQMASRLSTRTGMAIYVSCQLEMSSSGDGPGAGASGGGSHDGLDSSWSTGLDSEIIVQRAAAVAEKEIWRILQEQQQNTTTVVK
jgi:hypothetical protein